MRVIITVWGRGGRRLKNLRASNNRELSYLAAVLCGVGRILQKRLFSAVTLSGDHPCHMGFYAQGKMAKDKKG